MKRERRKKSRESKGKEAWEDVESVETRRRRKVDIPRPSVFLCSRKLYLGRRFAQKMWKEEKEVCFPQEKEERNIYAQKGKQPEAGRPLFFSQL